MLSAILSRASHSASGALWARTVPYMPYPADGSCMRVCEHV